MAKRQIKILLVEDDPDDLLLMQKALSEANSLSVEFKLEHVDRLGLGIEFLKTEKVDVILLDLSLPDSQGMETFLNLYQKTPTTPIVILTRIEDELFALESVRKGAQDYLTKETFNGKLLSRVIRYAIERKHLLQFREEIVNASSHELKTPLCIIKESISILLDGITGNLTQQQNEILKTARENVERLEHLIDRLLAVSQLDTDKKELKKSESTFKKLS